MGNTATDGQPQSRAVVVSEHTRSLRVADNIADHGIANSISDRCTCKRSTYRPATYGAIKCSVRKAVVSTANPNPVLFPELGAIHTAVAGAE
jgi:hypothetical protein